MGTDISSTSPEENPRRQWTEYGERWGQALMMMNPQSPKPQLGFQEQPSEHLSTNALKEEPHSKNVFSKANANYIYDNKKSEGKMNTRNEDDDCKIGDNRKNERELKVRT